LKKRKIRDEDAAEEFVRQVSELGKVME